MKKELSFYVASSWRNGEQPAVVRLVRDMGHEVYDFRNPPGASGFSWSDIDPGWEFWSVERYRDVLLHSAVARDGYERDMEGMLAADACVVVMPCGRSAHLEAGWFCGRGKPCVFWFPLGVRVEAELMVYMALDAGGRVLVGYDELKSWVRDLEMVQLMGGRLR